MQNEKSTEKPAVVRNFSVGSMVVARCDLCNSIHGTFKKGDCGTIIGMIGDNMQVRLENSMGRVVIAKGCYWDPILTDKRGPQVVFLFDGVGYKKGDTGTLLEVLMPHGESPTPCDNPDYHANVAVNGKPKEGNGNLVTVNAICLCTRGLNINTLRWNAKAIRRLLLAFNATTSEGKKALAKDVQDSNDLNAPGFDVGDRVDRYVKDEHGGGIHQHGVVSKPEYGHEGIVGVTFDGELDYSIVRTSELRHLSDAKKPVEPSSEKDYDQKVNQILEGCLKMSSKDILCLAEKLEDLAKKASPCTCIYFSEGFHAIHRSCEVAALNGVPINLPTMKFCPWCGGSLQVAKEKPCPKNK